LRRSTCGAEFRLTSAVGTSNEAQKPYEVEQKRRAFNDWMRNNGGQRRITFLGKLTW